MRLIPIYTWTKGIRNFDHRRKQFSQLPWAQGVLLLCCVVVAMLLANLPFTKEFYHNFLETDISLRFQSPGGESILFPNGMTVEKFINDILMTVFFFTVGLEIRREMKNGELSSLKKAMMPVIAAFGGVVAPALIFTAINHGSAAASGWGIPTATDIAFAVGILSILGDRVPVSLKVFLTALAIADDLIAILVVALFYGGTINFGLLSIAFVLIALVLLMNKLGEKRGWFYLVPAIAIWSLFYYAGIHSTMSGVVMAFLVPMTPRFNEAYFHRKRLQYIRRLNEYNGIASTSSEFPNGPQRHCLRRLSAISRDSIGMSYRLEHALGPWVNFLIMPIFALANAGVEIPDVSYFNVFQFDQVLGSVSMGIFLGLVISTVRLVVRRGLNLCCPGWCLCDPFFYRNQDDLVFLESFRVEMQVRIGVVDLLKGHIVSLADRVKGLTFLHYMRIVHLSVIAYLVSGHHNLRRDVFLCGSYGAGRGRQT